MLKSSGLTIILIVSVIITSILFIVNPSLLTNKKPAEKAKKMAAASIASTSSTTIWSDNFNNGCTANCLATTWNGWTMQDNIDGTTGSAPNDWFVSCAEEGVTPPGCGSTCAGDASLHIGANPSAGGDQGASYNETGAVNATYRRMVSPTINTSGYENVVLKFDFIAFGSASCADDRAQLHLSTDGGATWNAAYQYCLTSPCCGACNGYSKGQWTVYTLNLPAAFANNPNVKIGFHWRNNGNGSGTDPSVAIDDISISGTVIDNPTTWNGTTWSNGTPNANISAIIASNTAPASFTCKTLTINNGFALTTTGITATVNDNIINNGNGVAGNGNLIIAANSSLSGNAINFNGTLTVNGGATLTTNNLLTITSTASGTGRIGNSAGSIVGNVTVQKYIAGGGLANAVPSRRAYRFLSHPFASSIALNQLNGSGEIDVTGSGGVTNGFDATLTNNPSAFFYNTSTGNGNVSNDAGWTAYTNANTNSWARGQGLRVFYRGNKGQGLNYSSSPLANNYTVNNTTLSLTGAINQGNQTINLVNAGANWNFVGNPFASPVNLQNVARTNVSNMIYVWRLNQGTRGAYSSAIDLNTTSYHLPAFSAFFVQATGANPNMIFEEADKVNTETSDILFRTQSNYNIVKLKLLSDDGTIFWDDLTIRFNKDRKATKETGYDGDKWMNSEVNFYSLSADNKHLSLDTRTADTNAIALGINTNTTRNFKLVADEVDAPQGYQLYIKDNYTGSLVLLDKNTTFNFGTTANTNSQGNNRLELILKKMPAISTNANLTLNILNNPSKNNISIGYTQPTASDLQLSITTLNGVVLYNKSLGNQLNGIKNISTVNLSSATYIITLSNNKERVSHKVHVIKN